MAKKALKKLVRKRKPKESFVEEPSSFVPDSQPEQPLCDCGEQALPNNHQCYRCSHRS